MAMNLELRIAGGAMIIGATLLIAAVFPDPTIDDKNLNGKETIVLAGGCFWCVEAGFQQIAGVEKVVSGYSGGEAATAHYEIVSTGTTGHAESVQVTFNPQKISYGKILKVFFDVAHDPTQLNRKGPDRGHNTGLRSSTQTHGRRESPRRTSSSWTTPRYSALRS